MAGTGCRHRVGIAARSIAPCDDAVIGKLWRMDVLINLLPWLAPPILGAVIGYVTNRIAIQMLFRPRAEKRILGFHVPFTPGIIPKNRNELAESIARAVAGELISPEAVRARLNNPELKVGLETWIRAQRRSLMESRLDTSGADVQELLADLMPTMTEGLRRMLHQPGVRAAMVEVETGMVRDTVANLGAVAGTAIGASGMDRVIINRMPAIVDAIIASAESTATPDRMAGLIRQWMRTDGAKSASDFLVLSEATEARIDGYLMERLIAFLSAELPAISAMLNVERLVITQVKTLDVVEVERMILDVAGRHLKWINYLGAGLGGLIGLAQVALRLLG